MLWGMCQLPQPQKPSMGDNAVESSTAFTSNNRPRITHGLKKSISRSTVDLAFRNALEEQGRVGFVSGPRKLGVPGVRSNLYAIFLRFGIITAEVRKAEDHSPAHPIVSSI